MQASAASSQRSDSRTLDLFAVVPPLLFGLRLWASVCLALYISFWLQLDNPGWAGATAAIVCQPQLGASLRKGWFRMIGTIVGAVMIVVLTGLFPQDRVAYLGLLALWCALCAFGATVLRNFASYSAALAGYTAALIAADSLGATGGPSSDIFLLAVDRATEICIGIVCAGVVLAGTDLGSARRQLAASLAGLVADIAGGFIRMLSLAGPQLTDTQSERRELVRRVIALDPVIDQTIGESSQIRYHSPMLWAAVDGLLSALNAWRGIATHLGALPDDIRRQSAAAVLRSVPSELQHADVAAGGRWTDNAATLRDACEAKSRTLFAVPAGTPSLRLLADEAAKVLAGLARALDGLALLVDTTVATQTERRSIRPRVPDWLPAIVNAARAFVAIGAVEVFWVATAWPSGSAAIVFAAVTLLLLSPRGDLAYAAAVTLALGAAGAVLGAAIIKFAVLPMFGSFAAFAIVIGFYLVPIGFAIVYLTNPVAVAVLGAMSFLFLPLLSPMNQMSYDTSSFYNTVLAIMAGCTIAPLAFRLLPPVPPAVRARRLVALSLQDVRRLAAGSASSTAGEWECRIYARLAALPDDATPLQRAQVLAALSVGIEIVHLRALSPVVGTASVPLQAGLDALSRGEVAAAVAHLREFGRALAIGPGIAADDTTVLRMRGRVTAMIEAISAHAGYFDAEERS